MRDYLACLKDLTSSGQNMIKSFLSCSSVKATTLARKIHSTWFFNNVVNIKLTEHGRIHKIFHVTDIENLLEIGNLEEYINNASF